MSQHERENQVGGWAMAYGFGNPRVATLAYESVRDALLVDDNADASVFRFILGERSYVAIIAETPLPERDQRRAEELLAGQGAPASLADEVLSQLQRRRRAFKSTGLDYLERRT